MKSLFVVAIALVVVGGSVDGHNFGTNPPSWNREISRLVYDRCASCHRNGGTAFSLMTYRDAQPRAVAIRDTVFSRRMPPWGAVKGFGEFADDQGLTQEQIDLVSDWVEGGMQKGNNQSILPEPPKFEDAPSPVASHQRGVLVSGPLVLSMPITAVGIVPEHVPANVSMQITALLPNGRVEPLVWLYQYQDRFRHAFTFRKPITLPAGTRIRGVTPQARIRIVE